MIKYINLMKELNGKKPGHRDPDPHSELRISGQEVREQIVLPLFKSSDKLIVDLTGYNRYSRGFLNEIVEGLIVDEKLDPRLVKRKLFIQHDLVESLVEQCDEYVDKYLQN